ncbi:MAG: E3 binding domain-containing protein, partial [Deltaproteobacteria bacterium]|nr:E3 binding domain-containing protein [Deltaproteobacteria bacterium]
MATEVIMPALGMAQEKGTLVNWLKAEGDSVTKGEPLMEVETDKAAVEIEAPASGILANVTAAPGDEVPVGQKIAVILAPGESLPTSVETDPSALHRPPLPSPLPQGEGMGEGRPAAPFTSRPAPGRIPASPAARRIAKERGMDLASLKGSGPE